MQVGVFDFPTDYGIDITELAQAFETRGFASLYMPEHTHIPVSRRGPVPGGGEQPKKYSQTLDRFVALSQRSQYLMRARQLRAAGRSGVGAGI